MELAIISPPKMLELSNLVEPASYGMVLPEGLSASSDYLRFYRDYQGYKILDNGIVEGRQYTGVELHHMAYEVGANCIVVPDQFRLAETTIRMAKDFERSRNPELDYMGVLQGLTITDILWCLHVYNQMEWITHIGLPRILCENHKLSRCHLIEVIREQQKKGNYRDFKIHALGASEWIEEVCALKEVGCDSMDTSLPVVFGLEGYTLDHPYVARRNNFMEQDVERTSLNWRITLDNCRQFILWALSEAP